jgi:hypothetical protein
LITDAHAATARPAGRLHDRVTVDHEPSFSQSKPDRIPGRGLGHSGFLRTAGRNGAGKPARRTERGRGSGQTDRGAGRPRPGDRTHPAPVAEGGPARVPGTNIANDLWSPAVWPRSSAAGCCDRRGRNRCRARLHGTRGGPTQPARGCC